MTIKNILTFLSFLLFLQMQGQQSNENHEKYHHQFDFWLGDWEVYKYGTDTLIGKSSIVSIVDSLGLLENYSVLKGGFQGKSLNMYNRSKKRWEQYWIDNSGLTLFLSGGWLDGKMVLTDAQEGKDQKIYNQITWEQGKQGTVRQIWQMSKDGGETWTELFDGEYRSLK